jgi:hypothetical protein
MVKIFKKEVIELSEIITELMKREAENGMITAMNIAEGLYRQGYRKIEEEGTTYSRN